MNKTYTLQKKQLTPAAKHKAILDYHLIDDKGNQRVVHAVAKLGFANKVKSIQAKYYRETPLVEVLAEAEVQQQLEVNYTAFNKQPRISLIQQTRSISDTSMYQADSDNESSALSNHINPPDFLTLGLFAVSAYMLWMLSSLITTF